MIGDLSGLRAVVTGAGTRGGMGGTIAEVLARQGARVAVTDTRLDGAREVAAAIGEAAIAIELDVANDDSTERAFASIEERFGGVDVLVNNAGVLGDSGIDAWRTTFEVNVLGTVRCTEAVIPGMCERRRGKIVNIHRSLGTLHAEPLAHTGQAKPQCSGTRRAWQSSWRRSR